MRFRRKIAVIALVCLSVFFVGILVSYLLKEGSFVKMNGKWSIGIYSGEYLFDFSSPHNISNPIFSAKDVTDIDADFVADLFMIKKGDIWYMFLKS